MARILQMLWLLALALPAAGEFEHGPRPPGAVFDPTGFLEPELAAEISGPLGWIYEREGIDVIVVILPELGSAPPELVARRFAEAWCESMIHCVVLHVPAREDGPWIVPAGRLVEHLNPTSVRQGVADGERRAFVSSSSRIRVRSVLIISLRLIVLPIQ